MSEVTVGQNMSADDKEANKQSVGSTPATFVDDIDEPEGGLRAWLTVIGGWIICFCTFGYSSSFGVYQSLYLKAGAGSSSGISWIGSVQLCLMFATGLIAGRLFDVGYFHHLMFFGTLLYCFALFMLSLAHSQDYYQLMLSQGLAAGIGGGCLLVPSLSAQAQHWNKRRAFAMGIVLTGTGIGGIVYPIMINQLFQTSAGFAWTVRYTAFMTLGLLVIANCIMTTRMPSAKELQNRRSPDIMSILTDTPYMIAALGAFFCLWGLFYPYFYLQVFVEDHGLSPTLAFYTIAILNAGSVPGRCLPNLIGDIIGPFNVFIPCCFICGALMFAMFGCTSPGGVIVFSILFGFFSGACIAINPPALVSLSRNRDEMGLRIGIGYFIASLALLTGTPINGALLNPGNKWANPTVFSGVVMIVGSFLLLIARRGVVERKHTQRV
ncbi:major facilitator superfamily domain-containing protein [Sparassis latifolia]|uniref:Aspyridones efflux protein n=1 Tax=Sparassis crispa TaxID=139825 RepID=A0A401GW01_9APHY|nr:Aspyridones efflux protein [Sparassis crispa]GBE86407.1 Aspyridones efflux protein [Sparassis crispa]